MENKSNNFLTPLWFSVFLAVGIFVGYNVSPGSLWPSGQEKYGKIKDIIEILDKKYVDSLDGDKLFNEAISDMLHKLDPHSGYIPAEDMLATKEQVEGHFGGIGVRFALIRDTVCVTSVINGSPSMAVGVLPGDKIIQVGEKNITGKKIKNEDILKMLKGKEGTPVDVILYRGTKKISKTIVRNTIPIETIVCATMLNGNTGYIKLDQFSAESAKEFSRAASKLKSQGMTKLIFDLRNNGGGVLQSAAAIVDEFLKKGAVIVTTKGRNVKEEVYTASDYGNLDQTQLVVLINENSASASEIVAGALQDNDRATIVGRRSFGKGLVQQDIPLKDGSNLRLVVARYYTPTGRCIQKPYEEGFEHYYQDQYDRYENGELYAIDSTLLVDSLKYTTPGGKTVYGGGGIMPDVFVPVDTIGTSWYYTELRYSAAFQNFAFDFVANKRHAWKSLGQFKSTFVVTDDLLNQFVNYADKNLKVKKNPKELAISKNLIKETLKAEIARQIWTEQGYYSVMSDYDNEVKQALKILKRE